MILATLEVAYTPSLFTASSVLVTVFRHHTTILSMYLLYAAHINIKEWLALWQVCIMHTIFVDSESAFTPGRDGDQVTLSNLTYAVRG